MALRSFALAAGLALGACAAPETGSTPAARSGSAGAAAAPGSVLDSQTDAKLRDNLRLAEEAYAADPTDETNVIWLGRRLAYLGRVEEAIDVYTRGLLIHPQSYRLLRHRGHRFITLRRFQRAELDLEAAAELIRGVPDEVEPDGAPNELGVPRSTNHSNVYYHLGLARYLQGRYEEALDAYERGLEYARNDDMLVATTHWLYMTLRRLGRADDAERALAPIHEGMEVLENHGYYALVRMYRGWLEPEAVLDVAPASVELASRGYGVASWHHANGHASEARELLERIVRSGANPSAFGMIAAEVDLARLP